MLSKRHFSRLLTALRAPFFPVSTKKRFTTVKSSKVCRTTLIRILVAVALISSLLTLPAFSQDTLDSQIFISGFNAYQQQNYNTAIEKMNEVLQKYPNTPLRDMALFWLARAHFKIGHRQDAARILSQFSREYPDNPLKGTVEEELITLAAAYDKGEKIPVAQPATAPASKPSEPERQTTLKTGEERAATASAEETSLAVAQKEQEHIAAEKVERIRIAAEAAEAARLAALKAAQERQAAEQAQLAFQKAEQERAAVVAAEEARLATARKEQERNAAKQAAAKTEAARVAAAQLEKERSAANKAEEQRLLKQREAEEKARATKALLREKAITQYRSVIQSYPNTKAAATAAAKLKEMGISVAQPPQAVATGQQPAETNENAQVLQLEVVQFAGFEFRVQAAPRAYDIGRRISLPFEVTNRGNGNDSFLLESGFPSEFQSSFAAEQAPDLAITMTPVLAPNQTFKGFVTMMIPVTSIDGLRITHPIKTSSRFMAEATQSREIQISAAAPLMRAVLKTDQTRPLPGEKLVYRLVVLNVGSTAANDVAIRLNFPPQLEPLDHASSGFKPEAKSALLMEGLQVKSGERKEFTVAFQLKDDSQAGQDLVTHAELINIPLKTSSAFISNVANVNAQHGIKVRSGSKRLVVIPGETISVSFIVTNTGNTRDTFKIAATVTGVQAPIIFHDLNRDGIRQANEPVISEIGPLEPKEEASVVMEIKTAPDVADGSEGSVQLAFSPEGTTAPAGSGSAKLIYSRPVLHLTMSSPDGRLKPGEIASYDLTIINRGSNLARVVELKSIWPEQLELVAAEPTNSSAAAGTILWKFKELGAGEKRSIKVSFRVKPGTGVGTSIQVRNSLTYEDQLGNRY